MTDNAVVVNAENSGTPMSASENMEITDERLMRKLFRLQKDIDRFQRDFVNATLDNLLQRSSPSFSLFENKCYMNDIIIELDKIKLQFALL